MKTTTTLAEVATPDGGRMTLLTHDGQYFPKVDGIALMSTMATASEELMGDLTAGALAARKGKGAGKNAEGRILIGGLGFGFTLKRVLELAPQGAEVVVAELLPEIAEWNRTHLAGVNGGCLEDPRVDLRIEDVGRVLAAAPDEGRYDVILLDIDNGPDALVAKRNGGLYGRRGIATVRSALVRKGTAIFWSAHRDKAFAESLDRAGFDVTEVPAKAYPQAKKPTHTLFVAKHRAG